MKKFGLIIAALSLMTAPVSWAGSEMTIETSVSSSRVELGSQVTMDLVITDAPGKISTPQLGALDGFTAYSQGHSQEISMTNGQMASRSVFSYVLVANSLGKKKIGPFIVAVGGKSFNVAPLEVDVVSAGSMTGVSSTTPRSSGPAAAPSVRALPTGSVSDKDIFVQAWLDKDEVYVNEPIMLTYTFYTRLSSTYKGFEKEPVTTGFWVEDFPPEKTIKRTEKILDGSRYVVADVRKLALFPTKAGVYDLEPGTLVADVQIRENDAFDDFFSNNIFGAQRAFQSPFMTRIVTKNLTVGPVKITVKELPLEGKPASFNGAVGNYLMEGSADRKEAQTGDAVTYRTRVWGRGNISTLEMPAFPKLDDFKVYDSSSSVNISKEKLIVEGEKIAETIIVPKKPGKYTIGAIEFSYFDPKDQQYKVMKSDPHVLVVTGSAQSSEEPSSNSLSAPEPAQKEDVSVLAKDIRFIRNSQPFQAVSGYNIFRRPAYWVLIGLLMAGWMIFGLLAAGRKTDGFSGLSDLRFRRSHALARQKLKNAKRLLREEKQEEFYAEISRAIYTYFADKIGVSPQAVSLAAIEARAKEELAPELFNNIKNLFDELSSGRFARSNKTKEDMLELYQLADRVITFFERVKL